MGELNFLAGDVKPDKKPVEPKPNAVEYNKAKADLQYKCSLASDLTYVKRAVHRVEGYGYTIAASLSDALVRRHNGEACLTYHEADIMHRQSMTTRCMMLETALKQFTAFITEDDECFSRQVFQLRARYNKGLDWYRKFFNTVPPQKQQEGLRRLQIIVGSLAELKLPLHTEEHTDGFHKEFLKPEYLNWEQFDAALRQSMRLESIANRESRLGLEEGVASHHQEIETVINTRNL